MESQRSSDSSCSFQPLRNKKTSYSTTVVKRKTPYFNKTTFEKTLDQIKSKTIMD